MKSETLSGGESGIPRVDGGCLTGLVQMEMSHQNDVVESAVEKCFALKFTSENECVVQRIINSVNFSLQKLNFFSMTS